MMTGRLNGSRFFNVREIIAMICSMGFAKLLWIDLVRVHLKKECLVINYVVLVWVSHCIHMIKLKSLLPHLE